MIPLSVPRLRGNEWAYVKDCLDTEWISTAGKYVNQFEQGIATYVGASHAVACVNGTASLQVALQILGVRPGDEVIIPTVTFIATANSVKYVGAEPVFMDCDDFYNIDVEKVLDFLRKETTSRADGTYNRRTGRRIAAFMPVHVFGNAVDIAPLLPELRERRIRIVEDSTESLGTVYQTGEGLAGRHAGTIGDIGCYPFNGNKIISTGGGGMLVTNDAALAEKAKYLTTQAKNDEVRYVHDEIGYNFRLTNLQAALGVAQLEQLPEILRIKRVNHERYRQQIAAIPGLKLAPEPGYALNNLWMYALQIDPAIYPRDREQLMEHLRVNGIQARPLWHLNHLQKPYLQNQHWQIEKAPTMLARTLNIPCSANLEAADVERVTSVLGHG